MYVNFLSTYSDKKSCHTSTTLQTSIARLSAIAELFVYSPSIVTLAVSVAVCEIFSAREWGDLENRVRVRSRSLEMAPFDRSDASSY